MATVQSTYAETLPIGFEGMIVNAELSNVITRSLESASLTFGKPVLRGALEHGCILATQETFEAASAAVAGNTGNGTMGAITVSAGAKLGVYKLTIIAAATNAGTFEVEDPDGNPVDVGTVAVAFSSGGLAFTLADGATDFAVGDQFNITVTPTAGTDVGAFLGLSVRDVTVLHTTPDRYEQYDNVGIMTQGEMWVVAGATITVADLNAKQPVYWNPATGRYTKTATHLLIPNALFDSTAVDGGLIKVSLKNR